MAGTTHAPGPAWASILAMIAGFSMCTGAFIWHNNVGLWIAGGVVGAVGVVLGLVYDIMEGEVAPVPVEPGSQSH